MIEHVIDVTGHRDSSMVRRLLTGAGFLALVCACATSDAMAAGGRFAARDPSVGATVPVPLPSDALPAHPAGPNAACLSPAGMTSSGTYFNYAPGNAVVYLNIGAGNAMTGASVDASVSSLAPARPSDSMILFSSTAPDDPNGIIFKLTDAEGSNAAEVSTDGVVLLSDSALPNVVMGSDGMLRIEWFSRDSQGNNPARPDVFWSEAAAPSVCQGIHLACTDQAACDVAVGGGVTGMRTAATTMATDKPQ